MIYLMFILGFIFLIAGGNLLVDGAASIANRLKISHIVIGLTIVAFGTSAPELVVSLMASHRGSADLAVGNILGSNVANIFLVLGVAAIIYPLSVKRNTVRKEIPLSLLITLVLCFLANDVFFDGASESVLSYIDGLVLISFFVIFIYYTISIAKENKESITDVPVKVYSLSKAFTFIILGLLGLTIGGEWIVTGATHIARFFGLSESVIGLTVVAVGTSLPEIVTSVIAATKKNSDIAIGNVVGSNLFNILWVLGLSAIVNPLPMHKTANVDLSIVLLANIMLFTFVFLGKKYHIEKWQGVVFVLSYIVYIASLLMGQM